MSWLVNGMQYRAKAPESHVFVGDRIVEDNHSAMADQRTRNRRR